MKISEEQATQIVLNEHKETDKKMIRRKGENALYEKLRQKELREVKRKNEVLQQILAEDETLEKTNIKEYKPAGLAYGIMPISKYVEMLKTEIEQEENEQ